MPTTRKQKKARKSRGLEIPSDIENLDIMLGENHFNGTERYESLDSASVRRHDSVMSNNLENEGGSSYSNDMNSNARANAVNGQNSADLSSQAEIKKRSSELNSRISREMDEMMNSVSVQIQRAINDAISNQVLPQIQIAILPGSGRVTRKEWDVSAVRPEINPEVHRNLNAKSNLRNEQDEDHQNGDFPSYNVHDSRINLKRSHLLKPHLIVIQKRNIINMNFNRNKHATHKCQKTQNQTHKNFETLSKNPNDRCCVPGPS